MGRFLVVVTFAVLVVGCERAKAGLRGPLGLCPEGHCDAICAGLPEPTTPAGCPAPVCFCSPAADAGAAVQ